MKLQNQYKQLLKINEILIAAFMQIILSRNLIFFQEGFKRLFIDTLPYTIYLLFIYFL